MSENLSLPDDLAALSNDDLTTFASKATERMAALAGSDTEELAALQAEVAEMQQLGTSIKRAKDEVKTREAAFASAKSAKAAQVAEFAASKPETAPDPEPVTASAGGAQVTDRKPPKLNASLADAARNAPSSGLVVPRTNEPVLVASADVPGFTTGGKLENLDALVAAVTARARSIPATKRGDDAPRYTVASLMREHRYNLDPMATPAQINEVITAATNPAILTASGGWCSPSEISYDFYNVVCEDGMLDLPTVGINRGGIRFPTSPSFADVTSSTALWRWTETQDIAAVTGTAQSGTKTCGRVPCPAFNEERLACDGICLTVGNLTEDAYPEVIANYQRLLFAAHAHKINGLRIQQLRAFASTAAVTGTFGTAGSGVVAPVLGTLELNAIDYRERYAMCEGATLEVVLPRWLRGAMRSDLRKRTGATMEQLSVSDARLMELFDAAGIRVQWVNDYQVREAGFPGVPDTILTSWPTTVEFIMYAPGTVVLGQGMRLDLGVIRDSVLNATNDYTAQWMEECWLMFKPGHEVRRGLINICADGTTGAHDLTACDV